MRLRNWWYETFAQEVESGKPPAEAYLSLV